MPLSSHFQHRLPQGTPSANEGDKFSRAVTSARGTLPFLLPTQAHVHFASQKLDWNSRDHRKGRHPLPAGQRRHISTILGLEWWNISWWVAFLFTVGSAVWVINGFFVFMPLVAVMSETNKAAVGWSAFAGGTLFEIGGYLMVLEALNRKHDVCFGEAIGGACSHHFHNRGHSSGSKSLEDGSKNVASGDKGGQEWKWFGTRWHEIGFVGSVIQFFAATVFWISTFTGIPGVIDMNNVGLTDGIYWVPQVIGGSGFIISSLLFMLETQPTWYHIRPIHSLGWHVGFWNFIGGLGFTLCGAFGIAQAQTWAEYQSGCSTFWGAWSFLLGSICQWIECLNR